MPDGVRYRDVTSDEIENVLRIYFGGEADGATHQRLATEGLYMFCCTHVVSEITVARNLGNQSFMN